MSEPFDLADLLKEHSDKLNFPGAMLMKYGPEDYIGATMVMRGSVFFKDSHTQEVREKICECFDEYEAIAKEHLKWLWFDEPPKGPDRFSYAKAPKIRDYAGALRDDDRMGFACISGEKPHDASQWQFKVFGHRGWQVKMGTWGLSSLQFSLPLLYVEEHPTAFQKLFVSFATSLKAVHGHGGHALQLSVVRKEPNEPVEAMMLDFANGVDGGDTAMIGTSDEIGITKNIKTIGWLTAINHDMIKRVGGLTTIRSELPMDWYALYDYTEGLVIQAGPKPELAPKTLDPMPATYVLVNHLLKQVRIPEIGSLHYGSKNGEPRITGWSAEQWLKRFDIEDDALMPYKAKLLDEPKLTQKTTLKERV
ncbi:MAG: DUF3396 domain-containing protein [Ideonella sp.]|nr:DUF3396 domain-containing protein [Ideonella sp.]